MARLSVVIADDNDRVLHLVKTALEPQFAILALASNGHALIDAVVADAPDAVVAEVAMPLVDGLDAVRILRAHGYPAPFVMISTDPDAGADCLRAGAAAFVCKANIGRELAQAVFFGVRNVTYAEVVAGQQS